MGESLHELGFSFQTVEDFLGLEELPPTVGAVGGGDFFECDGFLEFRVVSTVNAAERAVVHERVDLVAPM